MELNDPLATSKFIEADLQKVAEVWKSTLEIS